MSPANLRDAFIMAQLQEEEINARHKRVKGEDGCHDPRSD